MDKVSYALRRKQKEVALSHLRTRKLLEDILRKRLSSLDTLESTLIRVETAAGDVEVRISVASSVESNPNTNMPDHEIIRVFNSHSPGYSLSPISSA